MAGLRRRSTSWNQKSVPSKAGDDALQGLGSGHQVDAHQTIDLEATVTPVGREGQPAPP